MEELNQAQNDSLKVKLLNALCWKNFYGNPNAALAFAEQLELVDRIGYEEARIPASDNLALFISFGKYENASEHLLRSLEAYRINKDTAGMIVSGFWNGQRVVRAEAIFTGTGLLDGMLRAVPGQKRHDKVGAGSRQSWAGVQQARFSRRVRGPLPGIQSAGKAETGRSVLSICPCC